MNAPVAATTNHGCSEPTPMLAEYLRPLSAFLDDVELTEICINQPQEIWTESQPGWQRHTVPALTYAHCRQLATLMASFNGKTISGETPIVSAALPCGARAHIVVPPACEAHTVSITIRKPSRLDKSLVQWEADGAFTQCAAATTNLQPFETALLQLRREQQFAAFLDLAVRSHRNILVVGKTGSGKTTLAKSLIRNIAPHERLITIEDVHELFLPLHPNRVHLFYARDDEAGISPRQALAACLRMKPDRILLAELRGDEAWEFIKSINTGHPGSISTMHANGALDAFEQLLALVKDSRTGAHLDIDYIRRRLINTLDVILFYHQRQLREIYYDPEAKQRASA